MKRILILLLSVLLLCMLAGCECDHRWSEATCQAPRTCSECGVTEGELGNHRYSVATCVTPRTCKLCSATDGEPLGHLWADADCVTPETCKVCHLTQGEPLDHQLIPVNLEGSMVTGDCAHCGLRLNELTLDPASVALKFLDGQWKVEELYKGNAQIWEDVRAYNLSFIFLESGVATSILPDNKGTGVVTFVSADNSAIRFEVEINGQYYDVFLYKHLPGEMYWNFRDYYSTFRCVME